MINNCLDLYHASMATFTIPYSTYESAVITDINEMVYLATKSGGFGRKPGIIA